MILLAHDGSIYGDWVSRYALNFAAQEQDRRLVLLHVQEDEVRREIVEAKYALLKQECGEQGIDFTGEILPLGTSVYRSLRQAIPHNPEALLVCGTRIKPNKRAFLRGSVAEKLLRMHQCPVLALRVVQPGLLGSPHDLLLPVAGHTAGFGRARPVIDRLAPQLRRVHLFRALLVNSVLRPHLTTSREKKLLELGRQHLEAFCKALQDHLQDPRLHPEMRTAISSAWPEDVLLQANRLKVHMILLGVSERSLAHHVLHGDGIERVLRMAPCDVGIYRGP